MPCALIPAVHTLAVHTQVLCPARPPLPAPWARPPLLSPALYGDGAPPHPQRPASVDAAAVGRGAGSLFRSLRPATADAGRQGPCRRRSAAAAISSSPPPWPPPQRLPTRRCRRRCRRYVCGGQLARPSPRLPRPPPRAPLPARAVAARGARRGTAAVASPPLPHAPLCPLSPVRRHGTSTYVCGGPHRGHGPRGEGRAAGGRCGARVRFAALLSGPHPAAPPL